MTVCGINIASGVKTALALAAILAAFGAPAWSAASGAAPTLIIGGQKVSTVVMPTGDSAGNLRASVDFVQSLGATFQNSSSGKSVLISRDGRTGVFGCRMVDGHAVIQVAPVVDALGGVLQWDSSDRTATVLAKIKMIREDSDRLTVATGFPVQRHVDSVSRPNRIYVDLSSTWLGAPETTIPVSGDDVSAIRAKQMDPTTVRVALDLKKPLGYRVAAAQVSDQIDVSLVGLSAMPSNSSKSVGGGALRLADNPQGSDGGDSGDDSAPIASSADMAATAALLARTDSTAHISDIETDASTSGQLLTSITVAGAPSSPYHAFTLDSPDRLVFDLPSTDFVLSGDLAANAKCAMPLVNAIVKNVRWGIVSSKSGGFEGRIVFDLFRSDSYTISSSQNADGSQTYAICQLLNPKAEPGVEADAGPGSAASPGAQPSIFAPLPDVPNTVLSGKTIVVDPGHGGRDGGAPGVHGLWEKNINLEIGKVLRDELVACGARVILTRADDVYVTLEDRARMGTENHADYFVSVHADSAGQQNAHSGATVYYHANVAPGHRLASAIANRLIQLNDGIPSLGTRSDYVRFPGTGYSVLRNSREPAVIVETGYINDDHDADVLTDPAMQKLIAQGIVAGLKDFAVAGSSTASTPPKLPESSKLALEAELETGR